MNKVLKWNYIYINLGLIELTMRRGMTGRLKGRPSKKDQSPESKHSRYPRHVSQTNKLKFPKCQVQI